MRIITGTARGTKLQTLEGADTRPTTERVKEAVFSAIQFELQDRRVLDLFGGSGQLALEALSRGAAEAVIVDNARKATELILENAKKTKLAPRCRVLTADWRDYVRGAAGKQKFGLVFLDPPYGAGILDEIFEKLREGDLLAEDAILIAESSRDGVPLPVEGYVQKLYRYSKTYISIYRREAGNGDSEEA